MASVRFAKHNFPAVPFLAALLHGACHNEASPRISAEEAVLQRQAQGLEALIRAAEKGPLIPFNQILVIVDQSLVQDLLTAAAPYERTIADKYRIRVENAGVMFEDGFALVRLDGRAALA